MNNSSVEKYYRDCLKQFMLEQLNLKEYDFMLEESDMNYIPNDEESMIEVQKRNCLGLKFIYLRNELYLERLSDEEIRMLEGELKDSKGNVSEKALEIVKETYAKVITPKEVNSEAGKKVLTYYDQELYPKFVTMDTLVLKIGTQGEFDDKGNYINKAHEDKKREKLHSFAENMEATLEGRLGDVPIKIFVE